jgi:hypothetical protein
MWAFMTFLMVLVSCLCALITVKTKGGWALSGGLPDKLIIMLISALTLVGLWSCRGKP